MTLVQQFPDISAQIRSKNGTSFRNIRSANVKRSTGYIEDKSVNQYYQGEFRKWHYKFLVIVGAIFGTIYILLLKSFWIYNVITVR
jgi:hypothetical protein